MKFLIACALFAMANAAPGYFDDHSYDFGHAPVAYKTIAPAPVVSYVQPAPIVKVAAPVVKHIAPAATSYSTFSQVHVAHPQPIVKYAAPAPIIKYAAPAPVIKYAAPAPVYHAAAPVYHAPAPVYHAPAPVYKFAAPAYEPSFGHGW